MRTVTASAGKGSKANGRHPRTVLPRQFDPQGTAVHAGRLEAAAVEIGT